METFRRNLGHIDFQPPSSPSTDTSSPILVIAILGIIITGFLLLSYYIFVIKCWLNWHRIDVLRRFSISQTRRYEDPVMVYASPLENRGVDESVIRAIPIFQYKKAQEGQEFFECAVCLNEFQEQEKLRNLPSCGHVFHSDCIDIWLQNNANCPLCRSSISTVTRYPLDRILAPTSSQDQMPDVQNGVMTNDEEFVVIEMTGINGTDQNQPPARRSDIGKTGEAHSIGISPNSRKFNQRFGSKKGKKFHHHVLSMGDECIDTRVKEEQFSVIPIRRSISMDSSNDRQLYLDVQDIIQQNRHHNEVSISEGVGTSSGMRRVRRSFFSFGHSSRGSRNAALPIHFES